jgi:hypothetical protein
MSEERASNPASFADGLLAERILVGPGDLSSFAPLGVDSPLAGSAQATE